jgi:hypothetical protein
MSEDQGKRWPCALSDGHVTPCWALGEALQERGRGTRSQGLEFQTLVNMETMAHSRDLVVLKSGQHGKKGLALNFCPFCREELLKGETERLAEALARRALPAGASDGGARS